MSQPYNNYSQEEEFTQLPAGEVTPQYVENDQAGEYFFNNMFDRKIIKRSCRASSGYLIVSIVYPYQV
jgi:hypothetical protein